MTDGVHRSLIVARMRPGTEEDIAGVFSESDRGALPGLVGVRARTLFRYGDIYLHLLEGERPLGPAVQAAKGNPAFREVSERLEPFVTPYDPKTWRGPADAMAQEFYRWQR